uniref:Uncharacterized protein n=2 Tax=Hemiselmis andersenii TaxID=464988 RepID=A0A6T8JVB3_HEMAN|mmetsp:Transcript_17665/g.42604  ORF Transcript_17665/g.42604 Transcript_17665/m.42604 type:complete len:460 (+) Transcript_17665:283-1662(+)
MPKKGQSKKSDWQALFKKGGNVDLSWGKGGKISQESGEKIGKELSSNSSVRSLNVSGNELRAKGSLAILEGLKTNATLQSLELSANCIEGDAAFGQRAAEVLAANTTLEELNFMCNTMYAEGLKGVGEGLKTNTTLRTLNLNGVGLSTEEDAEVIAGMLSHASLTSLDIGDGHFEEHEIATICNALASNGSLEALNLGGGGGNSIGPAAARALLKSLESNSTLHTLDLNLCYVDPDALGDIAEILGKNLGLRFLNMGEASVTNEGAVAIGEALKTNSTLLHLDLSDNFRMDDVAGIQAIMDALGTPNNTALQSLSLRCVRPGPMKDACKAMASAVSRPGNLECLDIRDVDIGAQGGQQIAKSLLECPRSRARKVKTTDEAAMKAMKKLGLKVDSAENDFGEEEYVIYVPRSRWEERLLAFAMGRHNRLGRSSQVLKSGLKQEICELIARMYWGASASKP